MAGDTLDFSDEVITGLSFSGSTLTVTTLDGDTDPISLTGTFTGLSATSDGGGGSAINTATSPYALTAARDVVLSLQHQHGERRRLDAERDR